MTSYSDPENTQDIMKYIVKSKTMKDVNDLLEKTFPNFVVNSLAGYSKDYPHLDINWQAMCETLKVDKAQIILTQDYPDDTQHSLVKTFCEILTQSGFIVRKHTEFIPCSVCNLALPSESVHTKMKENKVPCPSVWSNKCSSC